MKEVARMRARPSATFGEWLKAKRKEQRVTLREFAERSGVDPGNLSRYERGILPPPQSETLERIGNALGFKQGSENFVTLRDLAAAAAGRIPQDLAKDPRVVSQLPVLFRVARGKKLSRDELIKLAERIQKG